MKQILNLILSLMTYEECIKDKNKDRWMEAINEEKKSLAENHTWKLVDEEKAAGKEALTSKWIFKIKDDGRYKARLVVRGCQQKEGVLDYKETFSPLVETNSLRLLFALAAKENLNIMTFDIKTAFLHGELEEEIYIKIPEGYNAPGKVCLLKKHYMA